jgi:hypothetical protein
LQHCSDASSNKTNTKKKYGALQLSCNSAKEVEGTAVAFFFSFFRCKKKKKGDGSVVAVAFFAEEEGEEEEEGEVATL